MAPVLEEQAREQQRVDANRAAGLRASEQARQERDARRAALAAQEQQAQQAQIEKGTMDQLNRQREWAMRNR